VDQLIPSLLALVEGFRPCFRHEVFHTFQHILVGWIVCPGPRTISEVWQATGRAATHHHDTAYSLFSSAVWEWDELGKILLLLIVTRLIPTGAIWLVVDDTLCHKRGAKVAFGGFFLDAVTSSRTKKNFRFGVNWVVLGLTVHLPFRPDRCFCLPVVWRAYRKKGTPGHRTRTELAAELAHLVANWLPDRECWLVGDAAYLNATVLRDRPTNLRMIGPLRWDAALYELPPTVVGKRKGRGRKKGDRLPTPRQMIEDTAGYPGKVQKVSFGSATRRLRVQVVRDILWYTGAKAEPVSLVLVRDVAGQWRDEALLATSSDVPAEFVIAGYCRRWSVEVAFFESKQLLGLHDPHVWSAGSVGRAHPMAWFVQSVTILWYAVAGREGSQVERDRPWYTTKKTPTFADMLGALRLQLWEHHVSTRLGSDDDHAELLDSLINWLAAVR
jgi:DDE superfamily endonuclease